ncbi:trypsin-2-like [Cochliomyia hominivorax]
MALFLEQHIDTGMIKTLAIQDQGEDIVDDDKNEEYEEFFTLKPRIAGGFRPTKLVLAKYAVSLRFRTENNRNFGYTHFCAGSIIKANKILTAAHCVYRSGKRGKRIKFKIVAKTPLRLRRSSETQEVEIKEIIIHPKYSEKTMFHDIALLILKENILLDGKYAAQISLPKHDIEAGSRCTVIGWGKLYMYGPSANEILFVDIFLHSRADCRRKIPNISGKKICASDRKDPEKDSCLGDSGGPLICNGILTGIVSYGFGCASGNPGIYTNVFKYIDWINSSGISSIKPILLASIMNFILRFF